MSDQKLNEYIKAIARLMRIHFALIVFKATYAGHWDTDEEWKLAFDKAKAATVQLRKTIDNATVRLIAAGYDVGREVPARWRPLVCIPLLEDTSTASGREVVIDDFDERSLKLLVRAIVELRQEHMDMRGAALSLERCHGQAKDGDDTPEAAPLSGAEGGATEEEAEPDLTLPPRETDEEVDAPKPKRRRKKRASDTVILMTAKQAEVVQIVGECKGSLAEAARRLGKDRSTVAQHYDAAMAKLGQTAVTHRTQRTPTDRRGNSELIDGSDQRGI